MRCSSSNKILLYHKWMLQMSTRSDNNLFDHLSSGALQQLRQFINSSVMKHFFLKSTQIIIMGKQEKMWGKAFYEHQNITPIKGEDFITGNQPCSLYQTLLLQFSSLSISYICGLPLSKNNFSGSKQLNQSLQKLELVSKLFEPGWLKIHS